MSNTITITLEEEDRIMHPEAELEHEKNGFYETKRVEEYRIRSNVVRRPDRIPRLGPT